MKCLFLSPKRYSLNNSIIKGFSINGWNVKTIDYEDFFEKFVNKFVARFESLPNRIKNYWKRYYIKSINEEYIRIFQEYRPDLVFIYNNQNLLPETLYGIKKNAKICFYLGDNPLYTPTNVYNLQILFQADYIISPDSFWCEQLRTMGIKNIFFDCFGFDGETYFPYKPEANDLEKYSSDLVYVGTAHKISWGYKRFLFLDQFNSFNLKAYMGGDGYSKRWGDFFPGLEDKIVSHNAFDAHFNNTIYNCSKIGPVDLVPALFNGIHIRVIDLLGAGIFPLCEYSKDLDTVFCGLNIPFIKNYNECKPITNNLLNHDDIREDFIYQMRNRINENYHPAKVIKRMTDYVF